MPCAPLNFAIVGQDLDDALKDAVRSAAVDAIGGWAAYEIGQGYHKEMLDVVTHKVLHAMAGGATGALFNPSDPLKGAMSGAAANFMAETMAEMIGQDSNFVVSTADLTRVSTALAIHLMNLDVNTAIHTSTLALENNFSIVAMPRLKEDFTPNDLYEDYPISNMTSEEVEEFKTELDIKVEECEKFLGRPLDQGEYKHLSACALDNFMEDGPGKASAYALINAPQIPGVLVKKGLDASNIASSETADCIATGVDRFVFFLTLAYGSAAGASYTRAFTSGVAPKIGKNLAPGLAATGATVEQKATQLPHTDYTTPEAPFTFRIDPITGRGPMSIDARDFTSATSYTAEGAARNKDQFWKMWNEKYPGTLSEANLERINLTKPRSPIVDTQWLEHFPEHQNYLGDVLVHHHINHGHLTTALPDLLHRKNPGRAIFHNNLGGKKK